MIRRLCPSCIILCCFSLSAEDWPDFDRPGILFAPSVLPVGAWSVELGLPEVSIRNREQQKWQQAGVHTMVRYGLEQHWELQFEFEPYLKERIHNNDVRETITGYSDLRLGARFDASDWLAGWFHADAVALQAGITLNTGHRDFTESGTPMDLGIVVSWDLWTEGHAVDLMLQWEGTGSDSLGFAAITYSAPVKGSFLAFVETGLWFGDTSAAIAGGGLVWRPAVSFQLDGFVLQRLSGDIADTQWGLGISWMWP